MNHTTFIELSRQFVQYYPASAEPCKQIQCFAFLDHPDQVLDENLGQNIKDKESNFFSRAWAEAGHNASNMVVRYPILTINIDRITPAQVFKDKKAKAVFQYMITIADAAKDQKSDKGATDCEKRHSPAIMDQCSQFMQHYFDYLMQSVYAVDNTGAKHWAHQGLLDYWISQGAIISYEVDTGKTSHFKNALRQRNPEELGGWMWASGEAYGVRAVFEVVYDLCDNKITMDFRQQYGKVKTSFGNQTLKSI